MKQGEVKKQEVAVLYLADYPHASSRLQGERADSLNRQEQAAHRPHNTWFAETLTRTPNIHLPVHTHKRTEQKVLFLSLFQKNTHMHTSTQSIYQANKKSEISKLFRLEILYKQAHFYKDANNNFGRKTKHKLSEPVQGLHTGAHRRHTPMVTMTSQNRFQILHSN